MNLAVSTLVLFFLFIVPGLLFRRAYYSGVFSKQYFKATPFQVFVSSIIPGVLFQLSFCWIMIQFFPIDFNFILDLLKTNLDAFKSLTIRSGDLLNILSYQVLLFLYTFIWAKSLKTIVRGFKLDRKLKEFRFQNRWHYILSGEVLNFPGHVEKEGVGVNYIHLRNVKRPVGRHTLKARCI